MQHTHIYIYIYMYVCSQGFASTPCTVYSSDARDVGFGDIKVSPPLTAFLVAVNSYVLLVVNRLLLSCQFVLASSLPLLLRC